MFILQLIQNTEQNITFVIHGKTLKKNEVSFNFHLHNFKTNKLYAYHFSNCFGSLEMLKDASVHLALNSQMFCIFTFFCQSVLLIILY